MEGFIYLCFFILLVCHITLKNVKTVISAIVLFIIGISIPDLYIMIVILDILLFIAFFTSPGRRTKPKSTSGANDSSSSWLWTSGTGDYYNGDSYSGGSDSGCDGGGGGGD